MLDFKPCPLCVDGRSVDISTGKAVPCELCRGRQFVTPRNICNCGSPCFVEKTGIAYCGADACYTELSREARIASLTIVPSHRVTYIPAQGTRPRGFGGAPSHRIWEN